MYIIIYNIIIQIHVYILVYDMDYMRRYMVSEGPLGQAADLAVWPFFLGWGFDIESGWYDDDDCMEKCWFPCLLSIVWRSLFQLSHKQYDTADAMWTEDIR